MTRPRRARRPWSWRASELARTIAGPTAWRDALIGIGIGVVLGLVVFWLVLRPLLQVP